MQQDPVRYADGSNLYQAVESAPVSLVDPLGLESFDLGDVFEFAGGAAGGYIVDNLPDEDGDGQPDGMHPGADKGEFEDAISEMIEDFLNDMLGRCPKPSGGDGGGGGPKRDKPFDTDLSLSGDLSDGTATVEPGVEFNFNDVFGTDVDVDLEVTFPIHFPFPPPEDEDLPLEFDDPTFDLDIKSPLGGGFFKCGCKVNTETGESEFNIGWGWQGP